jgi:uncharacterized protein YfaT (DUF1175 family)
MTDADIKELLEMELIDLACAMDVAGENNDTEEVERLEEVFDEAFVRLAKHELAQGRERPTMEDLSRMMRAYEARKALAS